jgi:hypothetical protein
METSKFGTNPLLAGQAPPASAEWLGMPAQVWAAVGALIGVIVTALASILIARWGPAWKARHDLKVQRQLKADSIIERYAEPITGAAFDLQSRLYTIVTDAFMKAEEPYPGKDRDYNELSTLWVFGQYFAWAEILRREVQVLDVGDYRRTAALSRLMARVEWALLTDTVPGAGRLWKLEQRATGELMTVTREVNGQQRNDCMGYVEFCRLLEPARPEWSNWVRLPCETGSEASGGSGSELKRLLGSLRTDLHKLESLPKVEADDMVREPDAFRLCLVQRALVDLIQELDQEGKRFAETLIRKVAVDLAEPLKMQEMLPAGHSGAAR